MAIRCPLCKHSMNVKGARAGRFTPKCEKCGQPFILIVPPDPSAEMTALPIPAKAPGGAGGATNQTVAAPSKARAPAPIKPILPADGDDDEDLIEATPIADEPDKAQDDTPPPSKAKPAPAKAANDDDDDDDMDFAALAAGGDDDDDELGMDISFDDDEEEKKPAKKPERPPAPAAKTPPPKAASPDATAPAPSKKPAPAADVTAPAPTKKPAPPTADVTAPAPSKKPAKPPADDDDDDISIELAGLGDDDDDEKLGEDDEEIEATLAAPSKAPPPKSPAPAAKPVIGDDDDDDDDIEATLASPSKPAPAAKPPASAKAVDATMPSTPKKTAVPAAAKSSPDVTAPSTRAGASSAPSAAAVASAPANSPIGESISGTLGGYQLVKRLGQGGMGAVYLARQMSLDRNVAVKTMNAEWASDPQFVARFTREAYAAAQLTHHNVVQIYDIGEEKETNYFSMEFVEGSNLGDLVKQKGKLDPEEACGYILQAARGLKFAHDQGMVHRDIKPDNLMLNKHGIVKVADLGLVKTPGSDSGVGTKSGIGKGTVFDPKSKVSQAAATSQTLVDVAMGTPAFMAPEQAANAAGVDHRADIYSLGCTLYVLVTGRPVHEGKTAVEVMTKHQTEQIVPPDVVVKRVPKSLSGIILKMTAKEPKDRYQDMSDVIKALEEFLGISSSGPFTPREEHAALLEESVGVFNTSKKAKLRRLLLTAFYGGIGAIIVALAALGAISKIPAVSAALWIGILLGLLFLTTVSYIIVTGLFEKTTVFSKLRAVVFSSRLRDWCVWTITFIVGVGLLYTLGLLWYWVGFFVIAFGIAAAFYFVIDKMVRTDRADVVTRMQDMLKSMRLKGLEEDALRQFVCKYSGEQWEPLYEGLFGYDAKMQAREKWGKGDTGKLRKKHGAWRDAVIAWADAKVQARKEAKEKRILQKMEEKALKAKGMSESDAKKKAEATAETMVGKAADFRAAQAEAATMPAGKAPKISFRSVMADEPDDAAKKREKARKASSSGGIFGLLTGRLARFAVGGVLIFATYTWLKQNHVIAVEEGVKRVAFSAKDAMQYKALEFPMMPQIVNDTAGKFIASVGAGILGAILVFSALLFGKPKITFLLIPSAVLLLGASVIPMPSVAGQDPAALCVLIGGILAIGAFFITGD